MRRPYSRTATRRDHPAEDARNAQVTAAEVKEQAQALAQVLSVSPGRPDNGPSHPVIEIAIYPDVVWLAARTLRAHLQPYPDRGITAARSW